jgi:thioredoxin-like negative regulator of GroEL
VSQLADAARRAPNNPDIRLHAAFAYAAAGDIANANMHLSEAIRRNPALEHRSDVEDLRKRLSSPPPR